jgi:peroxiredoxin family protein
LSDLLILAHAPTWEMRFQVSSLAASAAAAGKQVDIALFFAALAAWVAGRWDLPDPAPHLDPALRRSRDLPCLSELIAEGRGKERIRLYACSASTRFVGLEPAAVQARVDAILGWQSFSKMIGEAARVVVL